MYKVKWTWGNQHFDLPPVLTLADAREQARQIKRARTITILKENDGSDHPDNKGKWFLETIVK